MPFFPFRPFFSLRAGTRTRPRAASEDVDLLRSRMGADLAFVRHAPREPRDLRIVRLPLPDLPRTRELGLFLWYACDRPVWKGDRDGGGDA